MGFDIADYWERRYQLGKGSGAGSRGKYLIQKAKVINEWVVGSVLDIGCGDGYQAQLYDFDDYLGIDVSEKVLDLAREKNPDKKFQLEIPEPRDTHLSIDVMFHQVNEEDFRSHLALLFSAKNRAIVYSSNHDQRGNPHVLHRHWTPEVPEGWQLIHSESANDSERKGYFVFDRL